MVEPKVKKRRGGSRKSLHILHGKHSKSSRLWQHLNKCGISFHRLESKQIGIHTFMLELENTHAVLTENISFLPI